MRFPCGYRVEVWGESLISEHNHNPAIHARLCFTHKEMNIYKTGVRFRGTFIFLCECKRVWDTEGAWEGFYDVCLCVWVWEGVMCVWVYDECVCWKECVRASLGLECHLPDFTPYKDALYLSIVLYLYIHYTSIIDISTSHKQLSRA